MGVVEQVGLFPEMLGEAGLGIALLLIVGFGAYGLILRAQKRERGS